MNWQEAAREAGRNVNPQGPGALKEALAEVAYKGAKAALEALDLDTLAMLKAALEPKPHYPRNDILKAVVEVLEDNPKVGH